MEELGRKLSHTEGVARLSLGAPWSRLWPCPEHRQSSLGMLSVGTWPNSSQWEAEPRSR